MASNNKFPALLRKIGGSDKFPLTEVKSRNFKHPLLTPRKSKIDESVQFHPQRNQIRVLIHLIELNQVTRKVCDTPRIELVKSNKVKRAKV
jgi:hypothetical protein